MTFSDAKDQIAKKYGWADWAALVKYHKDGNIENEIHEDFIDDICQLYAEEKAREAWEQGYEAMKDQVNDEYRYNDIPNPYQPK